MENFLLSLCFGALGAVFGSFAVAQVWRLRAKQLQDEKASGEKIDSSEWKKLRSLASVSPKSDRSHCLSCGYQLKWYDLIPIISWLSLGGKCRKCHSKIGATEFLTEVSMFALFAIIFILRSAAGLLEGYNGNDKWSGECREDKKSSAAIEVAELFVCLGAKGS